MRERNVTKGMVDPRLEARVDPRTRDWRTKVTPTKEGDIGKPAKVYLRLVETAVTHRLILEGAHSDDTRPFAEQSREALATVRDEVRKFGYMPDLFEEVVSSRIKALRDQEKEDEEDQRVAEEVARALQARRTAMSGDWGLIHKELPGDFQARLGDVPPNVNFGNHSYKKDDGV